MNTKIPSTFTNKQKYVTMLNSINSRDRDYQLILSKIKKTAATLFADRHLLQKTNHSLFKANMRQQKEKSTKAKNARLFIAFERVLTPAQAAKMREDAIEKKTSLKKKKKNTEARKREKAENKEKKAIEKERMMKIKRQQMIETKRVKEDEKMKKKIEMKRKKAETKRKKIEMSEIRMAKKRQKKEENNLISKRRKRS
jgi:transcriptional regulator of acetoin/glycerol metabolism